MSAETVRRRLILGALLWLGAGPAAAQGFAGLGGDAGGFGARTVESCSRKAGRQGYAALRRRIGGHWFANRVL